MSPLGELLYGRLCANMDFEPITHDEALAIVAVVGAAEFYLREYTQGRPALTIGIEQSLNNLRSKLAGEGE